MTVAIEADLRSILGRVRDQGPRMTCLAHAATVAHEGLRGDANELSPEYLHYHSVSGTNGQGATLTEAASALEVEGQPLEADCPYFPTDPDPAWAPPQGLSVFRRDSEIDGSLRIASAIRAGSTPIIAISLPEDFFDPSPPWIIGENGPIRGFHAVAAVGLGTQNGAELILIRNSWGPDWGDQGHAWLGSSFLSQHLKAVLRLTAEVVA